MSARAAVAVAGLILVAGCAPGGSRQRGDAELDTVDVTAQPDARASLAGDAMAQPVGMPAAGVTGALPADFPREVPLPSPSSLVAVADGARELRLTLAIDLPAETVRATYLRQLAAAGFAESADGTFTGHGRSVRFSVAPDSDAAARLTVRVARP